MNQRWLLGIVFLLGASAQNHPDCVRGTPKPLLAPSATQEKEKFMLRPNNKAVETWVMDEHVMVNITQSGCADFVAAYVFTVTGDPHAAEDRAYWLRRGSGLLLQLPIAPDEQKTRDLIAQAVKNLADKNLNRVEISETDSVEGQASASSRGTVVRIQYTVVL
jgi:hypothetical protein